MTPHTAGRRISAPLLLAFALVCCRPSPEQLPEPAGPEVPEVPEVDPDEPFMGEAAGSAPATPSAVVGEAPDGDATGVAPALPGETGEDRDQDGIIDSEDECPSRAEDFDGYKDRDGCPDMDNDGDGILDINDRCPDSATNFC